MATLSVSDLTKQLSDSQAEVQRLKGENLTLTSARDEALREKAKAENALETEQKAKADAEKQRDEAITGKDSAQAAQKTAEDQKAAAEKAQADAEQKAKVAETQAAETAAKGGIKPPATDAAANQARNDSGDQSSLTPRQRLVANMKTANA